MGIDCCLPAEMVQLLFDSRGTGACDEWVDVFGVLDLCYCSRETGNDRRDMLIGVLFGLNSRVNVGDGDDDDAS